MRPFLPAKIVAVAQYASIKSALERTLDPQGWSVSQRSFIAGARSLNEEALHENLAYFKVPEAGIESIRSKLAFKIFDEYANILKGMYSTRFNGRPRDNGTHDKMDPAPGGPRSGPGGPRSGSPGPHICAADPLILSRYPPAKRQEFTAGPSALFRALIGEKRAKETRCTPTKRLEFTARLPFKSALVRLGLNPLVLGPRQRPGA
jgi:hypothetical protein